MKSHKIKQRLDEPKEKAKSNESITYEDTYDDNNNNKGQHSEMVDK
jgi:hypothetical protein